MDYVLFGMGYGATLMLLGWALRTFGPNRKYKDIDPEDIDRSMLQRRWIRFVQGLGGVISIAGTTMVMFTFIIMLVNPVDETGRVISLAVWAFLAVAILIWCWFYVSSFGSLGIWSREDGYGFRSKPGSFPPRSAESRLSTSRVVPKARISDRTPEPEIESQVEKSPATNESLDSTTTLIENDPEISTDFDSDFDRTEIASTSETEPLTDDETDPEYDFGDSTDTTVPREIGGRTEAIRRLRERQARSGNSSN